MERKVKMNFQISFGSLLKDFPLQICILADISAGVAQCFEVTQSIVCQYSLLVGKKELAFLVRGSVCVCVCVCVRVWERKNIYLQRYQCVLHSAERARDNGGEIVRGKVATIGEESQCSDQVEKSLRKMF